MPKIISFKAVFCKDGHDMASFTYKPHSAESQQNELDKLPLFNYFRIQYPEKFGLGLEDSLNSFKDFIQGGKLIQSTEKCFYIYRQIFHLNDFTGIIALIPKSLYAEGKIKKHEHTRIEKEKSLAIHFETFKMNGNPVLLTHHDSEMVSQIIKAQTQRTLDYNFLTEDGAQHQFFSINESEVQEKLISAYKEIDAFYIADGHHRCAAYSHLSRDVEGFMAYLIPASQLSIHPFHRVISGIEINKETLLKKLSKYFEIRVLDTIRCPSRPGVINLVYDNECFEIILPINIKAELPIQESLDVAILDEKIFKEVLGIENSRTSLNITFLNDNDNLDEIKAFLFKEDGSFAFLMHGCSAQEIFEISDSGNVMPPKSTYIEPKIRSGIIVHSF